MRREHLVKANATWPWYESLAMKHRDPAADTADAIYLSEHAKGIIQAKKEGRAYLPIVAASPPSVPPAGPGTELKKLLAQVGVPVSDKCSCEDHEREMNARGVSWCEKNVPTIVGWLEEEIKARGITTMQIAGMAIKMLVKNPLFPKSLQGLVETANKNARALAG